MTTNDNPYNPLMNSESHPGRSGNAVTYFFSLKNIIYIPGIRKRISRKIFPQLCQLLISLLADFEKQPQSVLIPLTILLKIVIIKVNNNTDKTKAENFGKILRIKNTANIISTIGKRYEKKLTKFSGNIL